MDNTVMQAFWKGVADLITAFFEKARRQGFSIMLLVIMSGGLIWKTADIERGCAEHLKALQEKANEDNKKWSDALNYARRDFLECDLRRQELAIKFAELTVRVQMLERNKKR